MFTVLKSKTYILVVATIAALVFFGLLYRVYILRSQAAVSNIDIEMNPSSGPVPETSMQVIFKPQEPGKKISAVDAVFNVENGLYIGSDGCANLETGDTSIFSELISESNGAKGRYGCAVLKKDEELPNAVVIGITVACTNNDPIKVTFDSQNSQIVGNVDGTQYGYGNVATATFDCSGGEPPQGPPEEFSQISASFVPEVCDTQVGATCDYKLRIAANNGQDKISGYYVRVAYDKGILKGQSVKGPGIELPDRPTLPPLSVTPIQSGTMSARLGTSVVLGELAQAAPSPGAAITSPTPGTPATSSTPSPTTTIPNTLVCTNDQDCINKYCNGNPTCGLRCDIQPGQTQGVCVPPVMTPVPPVSQVPTGVLTIPPLPSGVPPLSLGCQVVAFNVNDEAGQIELLVVCDQSQNELLSSYTNTLSLKAIGNGAGELTIASIQVVGPQGSPLYTVDKGIAAYVVGGGAEEKGNVTLKLKGRLQCVPQKPKNPPEKFSAQIGLKDGGLKAPIFKDVELTFDDKGHLNGEVTFDVNTNEKEGYAVYSKFKRHLREKICDATPKEDFPGAYRCDRGRIDLKAGDNVIDMSNIVQLFGDLAFEDQDGVVNSFDMAKIRLCLGSKDEGCVRNGDSNFDNIVNASDWACAIAALNERYDSE